MKSEIELINFTKKLSILLISELNYIKNIYELDKLKSKYLGKNSFLSHYFKKIIFLDINKKIKYSIILNNLKKYFQKKILYKKNKIENLVSLKSLKNLKYDISLSGRKIEIGCLHPITLVMRDIEEFFYNYGFSVYFGPELEEKYYNFDALNIPQNHPSRSDSDTFWFDSIRLLRTQTSNMQIRLLEKKMYPIKAIIPGKVYRRDFDHTHSPMFHQIEGLIVDKFISFANLKWILKKFICTILQKENIIFRFRSSYFPFTVPSAEMDIQTNSGKWLEILGCGMVHPNVLKNFDIDGKKYLACAFGIGIERIAMLKYSIPDIRIFFENDIRFLKQFV